MKKLIALLFIVPILSMTYAQKNKRKHFQPIPNVTVEIGFSATYEVFKEMGLGLDEFNLGQKRMKSTYYVFNRGLLEGDVRVRFLCTVDNNNTLDIRLTDYQEEEDGVWVQGSEAMFSKADTRERYNLGEKAKAILKDPNSSKRAQDAFFRDLSVNRAFFASATDLAGDRWFESYLKNNEIEWNVIFADVERNKDNKDYKYKETYIFNDAVIIGSASKANFYIVKYTNKDTNTLTTIGQTGTAKGYCRLLIYELGSFYLVITDSPDSPNPPNTLQANE